MRKASNNPLKPKKSASDLPSIKEKRLSFSPYVKISFQDFTDSEFVSTWTPLKKDRELPYKPGRPRRAFQVESFKSIIKVQIPTVLNKAVDMHFSKEDSKPTKLEVNTLAYMLEDWFDDTVASFQHNKPDNIENAYTRAVSLINDTFRLLPCCRIASKEIFALVESKEFANEVIAFVSIMSALHVVGEGVALPPVKS